MSSYYRQALEDYLMKLDVNVNSVLDIGGSANPVKGRTKSWDVKDYKILDNESEENYIVRGIWTKPDLRYDLNSPIYLNEKFDLVFCLEVFDYIYDPIQALKNLRELVKPEGKIIISFPFIYPVHEPREVDCLRYTEFGIKKLMKVSRLKIEKMLPRKTGNFDTLWRFYSEDKMHPAKGYEQVSSLGWICEVIDE
jgi:SAM-dependent methyltransferase